MERLTDYTNRAALADLEAAHARLAAAGHAEEIAARHAAAAARMAVVDMAIEAIATAIRSDKVLMRRIAMVYALACQATDAEIGHYVTVTWDNVLGVIFLQPSDEEHLAIMAEHGRAIPRFVRPHEASTA